MQPATFRISRTRADRALRLAGVGLMGALSLTAVSFTAAILPAAVAGRPPRIAELRHARDQRDRRQHLPVQRVHDRQRGTVELRHRGLGRLRRPFASTNWSVGNGITPPASQLTTLVGELRTAS